MLPSLKNTSSLPSLSSGLRALIVLFAATLMIACSSGSSLDDRNLTVPGLSAKKNSSAPATTVNRYLWSASLETVNFLPISSADPISGLIITDWYVNPESTSERFKVNVYILDQALRADALKVTVFRQKREGGSTWIDAQVNPSTPRELENAILTRARQLRLNSLN